MDEERTINVILANVVRAIDERYSDENIPQTFLNYLYLSISGLSISLGANYIDDLFNALKSISYTNILNYNTEEECLVQPVFGTDCNLVYQLYIKSLEDGNISTLEFITREIINLLCINGNGTNEDDRLVSDVLKNLLIEDAISIVMNLREYNIECTKVKNVLWYFKDFDLDNYSVSGYENIVNLFRPLFKFDSIKDLFIDNLIDGHYYNIYEEFDHLLGKDAFINMINCLKSINSKLKKKHIPTYEIACSYLNIRNKFIQSYINSKFNTI